MQEDVEERIKVKQEDMEEKIEVKQEDTEGQLEVKQEEVGEFEEEMTAQINQEAADDDVSRNLQD